MSENKFEFHFHAPVGQNIANVEHMHVSIDKDANLQIANIEQVEKIVYPREGDYRAVAAWLEEERQKGNDYYADANMNRSKMCRELSHIFGWIVSENSLQKAQNRN